MLHDPDQQSLFPKLPDAAVQQLRAYGTEVQLDTDALLFAEGEQDYHFWVVLDGEIRITKQVGNEEQLLVIHGPGEFTGEISMLTGAGSIATARASRPSHVLRIPLETFKRIAADGSPLAETILSALAGRSRDVDAQMRQQEKLAALGKLAAGLSHELNNPAAAARRAVQILQGTITDLEERALTHDERFTPQQRSYLLRLYRQIDGDATSSGSGVMVDDPIARSMEEDELITWLDEHGVSESWTVAPTLLDAGLRLEQLRTFVEHFDGDALGKAFTWLVPALTLKSLTDEIDRSTQRISTLVGAMKGYSYMDQDAVQDVDIHHGIEDTLIILKHRLKPGIVVTREYDRSLPRIRAYGSELNQVWTNLIDNALDAMGETGHLSIRTMREHEYIRVDIVDDGIGIPAAIQDRVWEPFFTTKGVGQGTGLGLDIALRIICRRHNGDIRLDSQPGHTRFMVRLPLDLAVQ